MSAEVSAARSRRRKVSQKNFPPRPQHADQRRRDGRHAIGAALEGMRPIVEMQFADFSSTALNQI